MATDEGHEQHDYTEGASNVEISAIISSQQPIPRARRDSQVGSAYDDDGGAVFDGEGSVVIPSSITNMRRERSIDWGGRRRRSISRGRRSMDSSRPKFHRKSSGGDEEQAVASPTRDIEEFALTCSSPEQETSPEDDRISRHSRISGSRRHRRRKASVVVQLPEPLASSSVFENIGSFFAGRSAVAQYTSSAPRRSSLSHRSSASSNRSRRRLLSDGASESEAVSDGEERWGYSSGEEDDESEDDDASSRRHYTSDEEDVGLQGHRRIGTSRSPSPTSSLPPMPGETDVFAQDTRLEIGEFPPEDDFPPPPPGPPSRQTIHLADDDSTIRLVGREIVVWKKWAWRVACILSAGVLGLIGIWIPGTWLKWVTEERGFQDLVNGVAIVQVRFISGVLLLLPVKTRRLIVNALS